MPKDYLCDCESMRWLQDNFKPPFRPVKIDKHIKWAVVAPDGTHKLMRYCPLCGKEIQTNIEEGE